MKKINWKNVLTRALWTFLQGFLSALVITGFTKQELQVALIGALAGGFSAIKTIIVEILEAKESDL